VKKSLPSKKISQAKRAIEAIAYLFLRKEGILNRLIFIPAKIG
jgi:hypothetical protein